MTMQSILVRALALLALAVSMAGCGGGGADAAGAAQSEETRRAAAFAEQRPVLRTDVCDAANASTVLASVPTVVARAAIAIDPSDGEQGKGDRLRAYAVLADVLAARGDATQAAQLREAVAAIRLSEDADDWWAAGLLTRAIALYEKSLLRFADAYCIQSRLALRYNELGDFAKAEQHYRRAFELMPESFGRIESHCFGCEGAFDGPFAQGQAERVFTRLAAEFPDRAQIFYLLGYLRSAQERFAEAADYYRRAFALDPDYLNAWEKFLDLSSVTQIPAAERETAALALLRLDPASLHVRPDLRSLTDLRRLWTAIRAAEATLPPPENGPLYPLAAVVARREALAKAGDDDASGHDSYAISRRVLNLRSYLSEHPLLNSTAQFLENSSVSESGSIRRCACDAVGGGSRRLDF